LRTQKPYQIKGTWYYPLPTAEGFSEEGLASWYGADFHGKPTSCGEPYNMYAMTAAHKTLPLGTHVKVSNLKNGRSIIVRVNDRGPFVSGRVIDLSCKAAQELGTYQTGLSQVRVEAVQVASEEHVGRNTYWRVEPVPALRYGNFTIQIGSFREPDNADRLRERMSGRYKETQICLFAYQGAQFYRVQVGSYRDLLAAQQELENLRRSGFGDAFVISTEGT
jgi:rare lipoprotein A